MWGAPLRYLLMLLPTSSLSTTILLLCRWPPVFCSRGQLLSFSFGHCAAALAGPRNWFEMFRMKDNETVSEMITRFTDITNSLVALGKIYTQAEMVRKVLRALTPEWEKKTTAIEEANDLSQLSLENLVGNLMAYEVQLEDRKKDTESHQAKKKSLAFKAMTDSEDEEEDEEEIAMFTRRFKKFLKKGKFNSKNRDSNDPPTCFRCNKTGHMKKDCPLENAKNKGKLSNFKKDKYSKNKFAKNKKAYQATWDDSDSSSEEETDENNEVANMCFMAAQEHRVRSSGVKNAKDIREEALDSLKAMGVVSVETPGAPPSPVQALLGGIGAGVIALILYKFSTTVEASLNRQAISDNFSVRQITITIRTIINGICYLATFVFGINSIGLFLYSIQLALNSFMESPGSSSNSGEANDVQLNATNDATKNSAENNPDSRSSNTGESSSDS